LTGDPKRSRYIAENFLKDPVLVNDVSGNQGYTGIYNGKKVSVMSSGVGIPSIGVYSYELYKYFDVKRIINLSSAGSLQENVKIGDLIIAVGASTNSNFANNFGISETIAPIASFDMLKKADYTIDGMDLNEKTKFGNILTSNVFYTNDNSDPTWAKMGVLAVEMEIAGLYLVAQSLGREALGICTISNYVKTGESLPYEEIEKGLNEIISVGLEIAALY